MALASTSCAAAALLAPAAAASTQTATRALRLLTTIGLLRFAASLVPVTNTMSTFGVAIKGRRCECDEPAPEPRAPPNVSQYYLSAQGASCASTCAAHGLTCSPLINTGIGFDGGAAMKARMASFNSSVARCRINTRPWWRDNQPGFVCGSPDPLAGQCVGWYGVPATGSGCSGSWPSMCRMCRCLDSATVVASAAGMQQKQPNPNGCREQTLFEHTVSPGAKHGVITQIWHAGEPGWGRTHLGDPRMRVYVDEEVGAAAASPAVDYKIALAHGMAARDNASTFPFASDLFGHTHTMGWYSQYNIPFQRRVRVTMQCDGRSTFWFRVGGAEDVPIRVGHFQLPSSARLHTKNFKKTVGMGALVDLANITGRAGMLTSVNMLVSSSVAYQEGCVQATVDEKKLWVSSGLEGASVRGAGLRVVSLCCRVVRDVPASAAADSARCFRPPLGPGRLLSGIELSFHAQLPASSGGVLPG
jgi:hypothetical protein